MEFKDKLQQLRKQKGLTQEELAAALFVSRTAVSKWESGRGYPNIDSLKALAAFFAVTVDELLSGDELLTLAEDTRSHLRDLVFGLLDCGFVLLFFLPFFGQTVGCTVQALPLVAVTAAPYLLALYYTAVVGSILTGLLTLSLQWCKLPCWLKIKAPLSLAFNAAGMLLFIVSRQPYAAALCFAFLALKAVLLLKRR